MKRIITLIISIALVFCLASCSSSEETTGVTIAIPNDETNEARALELIENLGYITLADLDDDAQATIIDVIENPYNIVFKEVDADQLTSVLPDVDYAIINSNYAISAKISPITTEGADVSYPNIVAVKEGNEELPKIKALVAAINSKAVEDYIEEEYEGAIVCDLKNVNEDGIDETVDYEALRGTTITIAASPTPHSDILNVAKEILAEYGITLVIEEYTDYVEPNTLVEEDKVDANYFQHNTYLENFNEENGTHLVSVLAVHHEPLGIYSVTNAALDIIR